MPHCQLCDSNNLTMLIRQDNMPLSNRYLSHLHEETYRFSLELAQCDRCALIQLINIVDPIELAPKFDWITYREPEAHLDSLADRLAALTGLNSNSVIAGLTYKDDSLLQRLAARLNCHTWRIDPVVDLDAPFPTVGSEVVLPALTIESATRLAEKYGQADLLIGRHVFEHAPNTKNLLRSIECLVRPGGYVMLEVPDCTRSLESLDYSMPWEEHVLYFTPETFQRAFDSTAFSLIHYDTHAYAIENVMMMILKFSETSKVKRSSIPMQEWVRAIVYRDNFLITKKRLQEYFKRVVEEYGKIAVFGAGHVSTVFIQLMDLTPFIRFVVEDDSNKNGLFVPSGELSICPSSFLLTESIHYCLIGLSPESEIKIREKQTEYCARGGRFLSIMTVLMSSYNTVV